MYARACCGTSKNRTHTHTHTHTHTQTYWKLPMVFVHTAMTAPWELTMPLQVCRFGSMHSSTSTQCRPWYPKNPSCGPKSRIAWMKVGVGAWNQKYQVHEIPKQRRSYSSRFVPPTGANQGPCGVSSPSLPMYRPQCRLHCGQRSTRTESKTQSG